MNPVSTDFDVFVNKIFTDYNNYYQQPITERISSLDDEIDLTKRTIDTNYSTQTAEISKLEAQVLAMESNLADFKVFIDEFRVWTKETIVSAVELAKKESLEEFKKSKKEKKKGNIKKGAIPENTVSDIVVAPDYDMDETIYDINDYDDVTETINDEDEYVTVIINNEFDYDG